MAQIVTPSPLQGVVSTRSASIPDRRATRQLSTPQVEGLLRGAPRLWLEPARPGLQVRLFRKCITEPAMAASQVELRIAAEAYFHLWVNGRYVTRGPVLHHPKHRPVERVHLTEFWQAGTNTIAVLVFTPGFPTHMVHTGEPGLWSAIRRRDSKGRVRWTLGDTTWKVTSRVGWRSHALRHGWSLGPVEVLNADAHPWGWEQPSYDDSAWDAACVMEETCAPRPQQVEPDTPPLLFGWAAARRLVGTWSTGAQPAPLHAGLLGEQLGQWLQRERWTPLDPTDPVAARWNRSTNRLDVTGLTEDQGRVVVLDLGQHRVGHITFNCESDSPGVIEIGWSEVLRDGRPEVLHKDTAYVDRLYARAGGQQWDALQYTGLRYLVLILRGFTGSVRLVDIGVRTSTSVPCLDARFHCNDKQLNDLWRMCARTFRGATQETMTDCPTREQAAYLGDGHLVGRWLGAFTGDYRHWRYLLQLAFDSQAQDGLMRDAPLHFVQRSLIDYVLLTLPAVRDYLEMTGDLSLGRETLEGCRRALGYFDRRLGDDSLLESLQVPGVRQAPWDMDGPPNHTAQLDPHLFIDHPGLGGHNVGDPGIDRHGRSAALNALYILALEALAALEQRVGDPARAALRLATAQRVRAAAGNAYWEPRRGLFVDAIDNSGLRCKTTSQQTNILATMAGLPGPDSPKGHIRRILAPDPGTPRCGPYFYAYLLPLMSRLDMQAEALDLVRCQWGNMLDAGATTLWETFAGDGMDTWCHPWSAAPAAFLIHSVLGLRLDQSQSHAVLMQPRYDLIRNARGQLPTPLGLMTIQWRTQKGTARMFGRLPRNLTGILDTRQNSRPITVTGQWQLDLPAVID